MRSPAIVNGNLKTKGFALEATHLTDPVDMLPTLLAAAGVPDVKEKLLQGYVAGDTTFKVHLDGYDLTPG